jgi:hypothetical protein
MHVVGHQQGTSFGTQALVERAVRCHFAASVDVTGAVCFHAKTALGPSHCYSLSIHVSRLFARKKFTSVLRTLPQGDAPEQFEIDRCKILTLSSHDLCNNSFMICSITSIDRTWIDMQIKLIPIQAHGLT